MIRWWRRLRLRRRMGQLQIVARNIEATMMALKWNRQQRKQWRRDFISGDRSLTELVEAMRGLLGQTPRPTNTIRRVKA